MSNLLNELFPIVLSNNCVSLQNPEKLIPVVILNALKEESIPVYGKGLNIREWFYVSEKDIKLTIKAINNRYKGSLKR